jgi:hypothetical protein
MPDQPDKEFVEEMRELLRQTLSDFRRANEPAQRRQRMISVEGPKKWLELKDCILRYISEINDGLCEYGQVSLVKTENDNNWQLKREFSDRGVQIAFDPALAVISYTSERGKGKFLPFPEGEVLEYQWNEIANYRDTEQRVGRAFFLDDPDDRESSSARRTPPRYSTRAMAEIIIRCLVHLG